MKTVTFRNPRDAASNRIVFNDMLLIKTFLSRSSTAEPEQLLRDDDALPSASRSTSSSQNMEAQRPLSFPGAMHIAAHHAAHLAAAHQEKQQAAAKEARLLIAALFDEREAPKAAKALVALVADPDKASAVVGTGGVMQGIVCALKFEASACSCSEALSKLLDRAGSNMAKQVRTKGQLHPYTIGLLHQHFPVLHFEGLRNGLPTSGLPMAHVSVAHHMLTCCKPPKVHPRTCVTTACVQVTSCTHALPFLHSQSLRCQTHQACWPLWR